MGEVRVADEGGLERRTPRADRDRAHPKERHEIGTADAEDPAKEKNATKKDATIGIRLHSGTDAWRVRMGAHISAGFTGSRLAPTRPIPEYRRVGFGRSAAPSGEA
jgi:hypothetical protein